MTTNPDATCGYCGAPLDPRYYFCLACAQPYKSLESVLPPEPRLRRTAGMRIREDAPQVQRLFFTYLAVVLGGSIAVWATLGEERPVAATVVLDGLMVLTTAVFAVRYARSLRPQLRRPGFDRWEGWAGLLALPPLLLVGHAWAGWMVTLAGGEGPDPIARLREAGMSEGALFLSIAVLPGFTEEVAFRGLVQHWLHVAVPPGTAIALAAALFTALHFALPMVPYHFLVGCVLGWLRWRTGSLWPPIAVHVLHNAAVLAWTPS